MAGWRLRGALAVLMVCSAGAGCSSESPEAAARVAQVKAQGAELEAQLDELEDRLIGGQALVHQWQELGRRHQHVSAVTCENLSTHVAGMERFIARQEQKSRKLRRARMQARVSEVSTRKGRRSRSN